MPLYLGMSVCYTPEIHVMIQRRLSHPWMDVDCRRLCFDIAFHLHSFCCKVQMHPSGTNDHGLINLKSIFIENWYCITVQYFSRPGNCQKALEKPSLEHETNHRSCYCSANCCPRRTLTVLRSTATYRLWIEKCETQGWNSVQVHPLILFSGFFATSWIAAGDWFLVSSLSVNYEILNEKNAKYILICTTKAKNYDSFNQSDLLSPKE